MECPKCHQNGLHEVKEYSRHSGLVGRTEGQPSMHTSGVSCVLCGYWKDAEIVPIRPRCPEQNSGLRPYDPAAKTATHFIVVRFFDSILKQRKKDTPWETIAALLTHAGHRCSKNPLIRYFNQEQLRRESQKETPQAAA